MVRRSEDLAEKTLFVENMSDNYSVFHHSPTGVKFAFERHGVVGSVVEVPERIANDPYFQRAIKRGRLRVLDREEAYRAMAELRLPEEGQQTSVDLIQQALEEGAAEKSGSRYVRENLPETGREMGEITQEQIWGRHRTEAGTVVRSAASSASVVPHVPIEPAEVSEGTLMRSPTDITGPMPPEQVLTEPVKQGEWTSDTGEG